MPDTARRKGETGRNGETRRWQGIAYRAHHPGWAYDPVSGEGARRHGGRFNRPGTPCLYLACDYRTAWVEAQQGFAFKPQPLTICAYEVDCADIADLTHAAGRRAWDVDPEELACAWEWCVLQRAEPPSWQVAERLAASGVAGIAVRSFAPGANDDNRNWCCGNGAASSGRTKSP